MDLSSTDLKPESSTSPDSPVPEIPILRPTRSILIAGASVRSLAESAIACGLRPLCADFFEDHDLTEVLSRGRGRFIGKIESFADLPAVTKPIRATIPLLWAGGLENHTDVLREISRQRPLIGAGPELCERLRDPFLISEWMKRSGIIVPEVSTADNRDTSRRWLRKPYRGSGGLGIALHQVSQQENHESWADPPTTYFQEFIEGVPVSATVFSDGEEASIAGMSVQIVGWESLGASGFLFCGNAGPLELSPELRQQVLKMASVIVQRSGLRGAFGLDFILRRGQLWLLEINPRLTASHFLYESAWKLKSGVSLMEQHIAAFGWRPVGRRSRREVLKKAPKVQIPNDLGAMQVRLILWAAESMRIEKSPELISGKKSGSCRIADVPSAGTDVMAGSPLCSIYAAGDSRAELIEAVRGIEARNIPRSCSSWVDIAVKLGNLFEQLESMS